MSKKKKVDPKKNIEEENSFLQMKLMAETGAHMDFSSELPPEVKNQFLKNIIEFENQFADNKQTSIRNFIGNPVFKNAGQLTDLQIGKALKRVQKLLFKNSIDVSSVKEVEPREFYRFIVEELFNHQIDDIHIEGMIHGFIYEEFHPNAVLDIENCIDHIIFGIKENNYEFVGHQFTETITSNGASLPREALFEKLMLWFDLVNGIRKMELDNLEIDVEGDIAIANADIEYETGASSVTGKLVLKLERTDSNYWQVNELALSGFNA